MSLRAGAVWHAWHRSLNVATFSSLLKRNSLIISELMIIVVYGVRSKTCVPSFPMHPVQGFFVRLIMRETMRQDVLYYFYIASTTILSAKSHSTTIVTSSIGIELSFYNNDKVVVQFSRFVHLYIKSMT